MDPLWSTLSEHRVISSLFNVVIETQRKMDPPVNTVRTQSDLFTVQCCHWDSKADGPPHLQHRQSTEWCLNCSLLSLRLKGRWTPHHSEAKAGNGRQLYLLCSFIYLLSLCVLSHLELSKWTGQSCISFYCKCLSISLLFYYVVDVVVVVHDTTYICCCCCCVLHNRNNNNYKIHINWLWGLC